jgi:hypothetical protein
VNYLTLEEPNNVMAQCGEVQDKFLLCKCVTVGNVSAGPSRNISMLCS